MKIRPVLSLISVLAAGVSSAMAEPAIERLLVTADFSGEDQQKIPASVSIIGEQQILDRQASYLDEILNAAPNVNFNTGASRGRYIQIRGIGERSQYAEPINPSVGIIVDDADFTGIAGVGTLFDVEQVEVLKGPQSTAFGAAALAGAIKIKTTEAGPNQGNKLSLSIGEQNSWNAGVAYGNAITDKLFYRVAVNQYKSDGFIDNIYLNRPTQNLDELTSRFKLKYLASDNLTLDAAYQYFDIDNGYDAFALDNDYKTRSDQPGFDRQKTHMLSLKADWSQQWGNLLAVASWSDSDMDYGYDEDWTYVGFHPEEYSSIDYYFRERETQSIDIRAVSKPADISWIVGFYAKSTEEDVERESTWSSPNFTAEYKPDNKAVYAEIKWQLTDALRLTTGLRVDSFDIDYSDNNNFVETVDDTIVGGKVVVDYQVSNSGMLYASVSRGYKTGGFNPDERVAAAQRVFAPEYNWNYEVGYKASFDEGAGTVRIAAFTMQRRNTQISDYDLQFREDGSATFIDIIDNADNGKNNGVEIESNWQVTDYATLFANVGWLDASFSGYTQADGTRVAQRDQAQAPKYTFNIGAEYQMGDSWSFYIAADGKDEYYFSDGHDELSDSFVLVNARLKYHLQNWTLALWGKNIFDEEYQTRGFGGFNNDPREFFETPEPYYQLGDGRQLGVSADYRF
ncbi:TonB-dependent receptor [Alteromonadaceae bacterium BrNp21-10]|nr:TonB-dependent receptor [Alteromonadaceae bacterium BrNp21-10]